jgi:ribosomal-protein-serine acetyltransferase
VFPLQVDDDVALLPVAAEHAEPLFRLIDTERERLRAWLPWVDGTRSVSDTLTFVALAQQQAEAGNSHVAVVVVDGEVAGTLGLRVQPAHASGEVGYWLGGRLEGRGVMTRAVRAVVDAAFDRLGLHRIELKAATDNWRSRRVAERAGFRHEGTLRQAERLADRWVDLEMYGLLATDRAD